MDDKAAPYDSSALSNATGTGDTLSVTFSFASSSSALNINSRAEATTPVNVIPDDSDGGKTATEAAVTAVAMAPQAMTATAGSVTTMAAVSAVSTSGITAAEQLEKEVSAANCQQDRLQD